MDHAVAAQDRPNRRRIGRLALLTGLILAMTLLVLGKRAVDDYSEKRHTHRCRGNMIHLNLTMISYCSDGSDLPSGELGSPEFCASVGFDPHNLYCDQVDGKTVLHQWRRLTPENRAQLSGEAPGECLLDLEGFPMVWCPPEHRRGRVACILGLPPGDSHTGYIDIVSLNRLNAYADAVLAAKGGKPDLEACGFYDWGCPPAAAPLIRKGLANWDHGKINSLGMLMLPIPAGRYSRGLDPAEVAAAKVYDGNPLMPRHEVEVAAFHAACQKVSTRQWQIYLNQKPTSTGPRSSKQQLSWNSAMAFCQWLTERERQLGLIAATEAYRLPTEAEWEWMMRGGTEGPYPHGASYPAEDSMLAAYINGYGIVAWSDNYEFCLDDYDPVFYHQNNFDNPICRNGSGLKSMRQSSRSFGRTATNAPSELWDRAKIGANESQISNTGFRIVLARPISLK